MQNHLYHQRQLDWIEHVYASLQTLPATEFNYYIALLLASIKNENDTHNRIKLLRKTEALVDALHTVYQNDKPTKDDLAALSMHIEALIKTSSKHKMPHQVKRGFLRLLGVVLGIVTALFGGAIGLSIGMLSDQNMIGNLSGACYGFLSGFTIGLLVGYRAPTRAMQPLDTKIEFCMDNLARLNAECGERKAFSDYQQQTKAYILSTFFKEVQPSEQDACFERFLKSPQSFEVVTTTAGHISPTLKGHLGHHSLIRFKINEIIDTPIEFGDRDRTPNFVDQSETPRKVAGQTIFNMMVLDRRLQDTHDRTTLTKPLKIYDIGSDDCRTYIDKILIGTGQTPTRIHRFGQNDSFWGRRLVAPVITYFSKTREDELHCLIPNDEENTYKITHHVYEKGNVKAF